MNCFGLKEYISVDCKYQDLFIEYYEILSNIEIIYKKNLFPEKFIYVFLKLSKKAYCYYRCYNESRVTFQKKCRASLREKKLVYDCSHLPIAGYGHARA